jgi:hypothetical protein
MLYIQMFEQALQNVTYELPERMRWKVREIKNIYRHAIKFLPSSGQQEVHAGQTIIVELPNNAVVDLASFCMQYVGRTTHAGKTGSGAIDHIQSRFFPRNSASIIQELVVEINGQTRFSLNDYNLLWNILHDYTAAQDSINRRAAGSENSDPSRKHYAWNGSMFERRGYSICKDPEAATDDEEKALAYDKQLYVIRSWLGLCSSQCTTTIIDTNILGSVVIKIRLAPPTCLMLGAANDAAIVAKTVSESETGLAVNAVSADSANIAAEVADYILSDINFTMIRLDVPSSFYDAQTVKLNSGSVLRLFFPNYSIFTGTSVPVGNKKGVSRCSVSTKSLDWVMGTFRLNNYTNIEQPLNSLVSTASSGQRGQNRATLQEQSKNGLRRLFNNSRYFCRNGSSITKTKFYVGSADYKERTVEESFNQLLLHYNIANDVTSGMYEGIQSIYHFKDTFYADLLSLNIPGESPETVSGIDTKATPCQLTWEIDSVETDPIEGLFTDKSAYCTPYIICGYTSCLEIRGGRQITLIP